MGKGREGKERRFYLILSSLHYIAHIIPMTVRPFAFYQNPTDAFRSESEIQSSRHNGTAEAEIEGQEFETNLSYMVRPSLKRQKKNRVRLSFSILTSPDS